MKRHFIFSFVFVSFCLVGLQAQDAPAARQTPADAILQQRVGEVVDYQKTLRRFETAIKETNFSSITDIQKDLVSTMKQRIELLEKESANDEKLATELKEQKEILEATEGFDFTKMKSDQTAVLDRLKKLQRFALLMADNYDIK